MFASGFVSLFFVALFAVNVAGYPVPEPLRRALAQRGPAPFEPIQAYINRDLHVDRGTVPEKRDSNINTIPEEVPTKAPTGLLETYVKRQSNINTIPEEVPTKAPTGLLETYVKRQGNINTIPEEVPTKAPTGSLETYVKRQGNINTIPEELPTKAPTGLLETY